MKKPKSNRAPFATRPFRVLDEAVRERAAAAVLNMPIDPLRPLQVVLREEPRERKLDQQALLFAGPMRDIAEQAWFDGRQYSVEVLHEFCKRQFLPEDFDPELCLEGYAKWDVDPAGERILVGSTTMLTVTGYSNYLEQVFHLGASLGVEFRANPKEGKL